MSSKYINPGAELRWKSDGEKVELFSMSSESEHGLYGAIDEDLTEGLLFICEATPEFIDVDDADLGIVVPEMSDSLYPALLDYIKYRLLEEKDDELSFAKSRSHKKEWRDKVYQKQGGKVLHDSPHIIIPDPESSLV